MAFDAVSGMNMGVAAKIKQRRLQLLIHSFIYYELNDNIVSDETWSRWGKELVKLQADYPEIAKKQRWHKLFADFDGSTGFHLAKAIDEAGIAKAHYLLSIRGKRVRRL